MRLGLFQAALRGASPEAARALMQQLLAAQRAGTLSDEAVADVALAYLELKAPQPPLRQPSADGQEGQEEEAAAAAAAAAALDAVPPAAIGLILELPVERGRRQLCALARRSPLLLGQVLRVSDPRPLLAEGLLAPEDLLELLSLVRVLAESHLLLAIVEAGHLAPAALRAALEAADGPTFTDIFKSMCTSDSAGQSFLKQCMQRAMPRADYGELMRISMLAEVAKTAQTVTDRATLLGLLEKAF
ncbi:hypothetical protein COHA_010092 [Chlorella ohadii]|uniref:Uncharacterized protein n=1 Tax=Chlorella ohadii TaxID=2649997 RepID=A0AAD5DGQ6_9CHLO|nr:hypothetical protein COHA_010092 [Chlorella ohadii]